MSTDDDPAGLSVAWRKGAAADARGLTVAEVAREAGVAVNTVYKWRKRPEYLRFRNALAMAAHERAIEDAQVLRHRSLRLLHLVIDRAAEAIEQPQIDESGQIVPMPARTLAEYAKIALEAYRVSSSQTGLSERISAQIEVVDPGQTVRRMLDVVTALREDEVQMIAEYDDVE